jgi:hypothetical protein
VVQVDLRRPTAIKLEADIGRCDDQDWKTLLKIILKYVGPLGNVLYHTVKTDQNGCFENFFVSVTGGTWQVSAEYPGGKCEAPEWKSDHRVLVPRVICSTPYSEQVLTAYS